MVAREKPGDGVVTTKAGLVVPGHAVDHATRSGPKASDLAAVAVTVDPNGKANLGAVADAIVNRKRQTAYDPDGRRRIGLTKAEAKAIDKGIALLNSHGIGVILGCFARFDGTDPCRGFMSPEGRRTVDQDAGFGCTCSRLHFLEV